MGKRFEQGACVALKFGLMVPCLYSSVSAVTWHEFVTASRDYLICRITMICAVK
jgi:hypothetical protein